MGELSDDVIASVSVQESDGSFRVTIPKDAADDLEIDENCSVLYTGKKGDGALTLRNGKAVVTTE